MGKNGENGVAIRRKKGDKASKCWESGTEHQSKNKNKTGETHMAKAMTKAQIVASIAATADLNKKQVAAALEALSSLAYKNAKNGFTVPGLGKLVLVSRKKREGRNPATGEKIIIPAKKVVKFRIAKAAKDAILGAK